MQLGKDGKRQYTHEKQLLYGGKDTYFDQFVSHHCIETCTPIQTPVLAAVVLRTPRIH